MKFCSLRVDKTTSLERDLCCDASFSWMPREIPSRSRPNSTELGKRRDEAVPRAVFNTAPIFIAAGEGAEVTDVDGNRFIDLAGGLGVLNVRDGATLGWWRRSTSRSSGSSTNASTCLCMRAMWNWWRRSTASFRATQPRKTMLVNSGAEAVDNRGEYFLRDATGRDAVGGFSNAFHGRTMMAMTLTARRCRTRRASDRTLPKSSVCRSPIATAAPSASPIRLGDRVRRARWPMSSTPRSEPRTWLCPRSSRFRERAASVVAPDDYLPALRAICSERDILFVDDEVQSGMGRTGRMFAIEHYGVVPDIVTTAKSLGAGLPTPAVTGNSEIMDVPRWRTRRHFRGNPVACAAALAVISELTETDLLERGRRQAMIWRRLDFVDELELVGEVRGLGPINGGIRARHRQADEGTGQGQASAVIKRCHENGVLIMKAGTYDNVVRLLAPLVISRF